MTNELYDHQVRKLLDAGFIDSQVDALIELFAPLKERNCKVRKFKYTEGDMQSAHHIFKLIRAKFPETKEPDFEVWADDFRKMRDLDNLEPDKIADMFQWAHEHRFWASNILSPGTLRKQWGKLSAQKLSGNYDERNQFI